MAHRRSAAVELFWRVHPVLYRWTGGRIGGRLMNLPVLLLHTRGARSREPRENALTYLPQGDACVVIASVLGEARNPAWYHNLRAQPDCEIVIGREVRRVRARIAEGEERERIWKELVARQPEYDAYAARTTRRIPVVVLEPRRE
jgi:deazaflavin-dependent oxidoreductase (nitroreductase family)